MPKYGALPWQSALLVVVGALCSCTLGPPAVGNSLEESGRDDRVAVRAVASTSLLADLASEVGGDRASVVSLIPRGVDLHTYQSRAQDAANVVSADIAFRNGLGLDEQVRRLIESNLRPDVPNIVLSDGIEPISNVRLDGSRDGERSDQDGLAEGDPHLWLDPNIAIEYVERIKDAYIVVDPGGRDAYDANSASFVMEIMELDDWMEAQLSTIPDANRKLVTSHDAFGYLARRYRFDRVGFITKSPGRAPNAAELAELVTRLKNLGVRTVFREPQINDRVLENVAAEAGVRVGELYSDSLDDRAPTYLDMMRFNTEQLVDGLR